MMYIFFSSSPSVSFWIDRFVSKSDYSIFTLKEKYVYELGEILQMINSKVTERKDVKIYFISSHYSFLRDYFLSKSLCELGYDSKSQRKEMIQIGIDKLKMKRFLREKSINTPDWLEEIYLISHKDYLIKGRYSTASGSISHLDRKRFDCYQDKYLEEFRIGVEYSVNVFCDYNGELTFYPVVWKGENSEDLTPPYKRLRIAGPYNENFELLSRRFYEICRKLCNEINNYGFVEFEFLVTESEIFLLEINPRVSGSLRIAAMACGFPAFDNYIEERKGEILKPINIAIEIPYQGEYLKGCNNEYICTTRATFAGKNVSEIINRIKSIYSDKYVENNYDIERNVNSLLLIS